MMLDTSCDAGSVNKRGFKTRQVTRQASSVRHRIILHIVDPRFLS